jgi:hypothetical protein
MAKTRNQGARRRAPSVMRTGKTARDRASGAWAHHRHNQDLRRAENSIRGRSQISKLF